jgi:hypothetical protein
MEVANITGATYTDTFSQSDSTMGSVDISASTVAVTRTGCMDATQNGMSTSSLTSLPNGGGSNPYTIMGSTLTFGASSDSAVPYDGTYTFMTM